MANEGPIKDPMVDEVKKIEIPTQDEAAREGNEAGSNINALREENQRLEREVGVVATRKKLRMAKRKLPTYDSYPRQKVIAKLLEDACAIINQDFSTGITPNDITVSNVPKGIDGDITLLFTPYQRQGKAGMTQLRTKVLPKLVEELTTKNPGFKVTIARGIFLNIEFPRTEFANKTLQSINNSGESYGDTNTLEGKTYVIDYSSPNIAKLMHVGHLRSTVIGKVMMDILESQGAVTFGVNHLGDWGTQFGQLAVAYELWGGEVAQEINPEEKPIEYLAELYKKVKGEIKKEEGKDEQPLTEMGRKKFTDLEAGEPGICKLWEEFRRLSMIDFNRLYERFGSKFDAFLGESFYEDRMESGVNTAIESGVATVDENGAVIIKYLHQKGGKIRIIKADEELTPEEAGEDDKNIRVFLLRKSDGGSNYTTRDLAALSTRLELFGADQVLYVTGGEQQTHFEQFFELSRAIGRTESDEGIHISFGMVTKGGRKIASREGAGGLGDLVDELRDAALAELRNKYPDADNTELEEAAEILGLGALFYTNFSQKIERNMEFDKKKMLDLQSQSAPYIQYACLRLQKVVAKCQETDPTTPIKPEVIKYFGITENEIIDKLSEFPDVLSAVTRNFAPHHLATYLYELAVLANKLYSEGKRSGERIVDMPQDKQDGYTKLYNAIQIVLEKGLKLLNIKMPKVM